MGIVPNEALFRRHQGSKYREREIGVDWYSVMGCRAREGGEGGNEK